MPPAIRISKPEGYSKTESLSTGDWIEAGVSHELRINGDASWVSYKTRSLVREGETTEQATSRIKSHINKEIDSMVNDAVSYVMSKENN